MLPEMPNLEIDNPEILKEKLKAVLAKRFVVATNALNLKKFHLDPGMIRMI